MREHGAAGGGAAHSCDRCKHCRQGSLPELVQGPLSPSSLLDWASPLLREVQRLRRACWASASTTPPTVAIGTLTLPTPPLAVPPNTPHRSSAWRRRPPLLSISWAAGRLWAAGARRPGGGPWSSGQRQVGAHARAAWRAPGGALAAARTCGLPRRGGLGHPMRLACGAAGQRRLHDGRGWSLWWEALPTWSSQAARPWGARPEGVEGPWTRTHTALRCRPWPRPCVAPPAEPDTAVHLSSLELMRRFSEQYAKRWVGRPEEAQVCNWAAAGAGFVGGADSQGPSAGALLCAMVGAAAGRSS